MTAVVVFVTGICLPCVPLSLTDIVVRIHFSFLKHNMVHFTKQKLSPTQQSQHGALHCGYFPVPCCGKGLQCWLAKFQENLMLMARANAWVIFVFLDRETARVNSPFVFTLYCLEKQNQRPLIQFHLIPLLKMLFYFTFIWIWGLPSIDTYVHIHQV